VAQPLPPRPDRPLSLEERSRLVRTFIRYTNDHGKNREWSTHRLDELVRYHPEEAWAVVQEVLDLVDDDALAYVAAGPLEDLIRH
jgi:hypothetical protein